MLATAGWTGKRVLEKPVREINELEELEELGERVMGKRGLANQRAQTRRGGLRRASATVEMAVVTPLLLALLLGMIEFGYVFMVGQSLTNGTRDACRVAALPGTTDQNVRDRLANAVKSTGVNITADMVTITHATTADPVVTVRVQVPYKKVSLLGVLPSSLAAKLLNHTGGGSGSYDSKMIGSTCSMRKEGSS